MTVAVRQDCVALEGVCGADDVEGLLAALAVEGGKAVDLTDAEHLHTAVLQVLMAFSPMLVGSPRDTFIRTWLIQGLQKGPVHRGLPSHG